MEYTFTIYYERSPDGLCPDSNVEKKLETIAKALGGREIGTGFCFSDNLRDIQYVFPDEKNIEDFRNMLHADHYWWINEVTEVTEYQ